MKMWTNDQAWSEICLLEDDDILIANKPPGIPSQPDQSGSLSMLEIAEKGAGSKLYLTGRLDRPVGGCMLFVKKQHLQFFYTNSDRVKKQYLAIVPKMELAKSGTLTHFLKRDGRRKRSICQKEEDPGFKKAVLNYQIIQSLDRYMVLDLRLETGRFHQIRSQLSFVGLPVKGDVKYGSRRANKDKSVDLHCHKIVIEGYSQNITAKRLSPIPLWDHVTGI